MNTLECSDVVKKLAFCYIVFWATWLTWSYNFKVWISFAQFELSSGKEGSLAKCRQIYEEANKTMRNCEEKEERLMLLESWRSFEDEFGTVSDKERVDKLMPEKVKKRRKVQADDGVRTQPLELVLSCQLSRNAPTLNLHFLWHVYSLRMGQDRAVWLL